MTKFIKWSSIEQFHYVRKSLNYPRIYSALEKNDMKISYMLKIKLHGTNACVRVEPDGKVVAQKRSSDLGMDRQGEMRDNFGFAAWVEANESYFSNLAKVAGTVYIYGEWCGPGIQNGVSCSDIPQKTFFPFAIDEYNDDTNKLVARTYCPSKIEDFLGNWCPNDVVVIPEYKIITIDFMEKEKTADTIYQLNKWVEAIGDCDPLIKDLFEVEGSGEGLVASPMLGATPGEYTGEELELFGWFAFKAKSEAHRVNATKTSVQYNPDKFASVHEFANRFATENRFLQALNEALSNVLDMRRTPEFIQWVVKDAYKESAAERESNPEIDWKACSKAISTKAVLWYKAKVAEAVD